MRFDCDETSELPQQFLDEHITGSVLDKMGFSLDAYRNQYFKGDIVVTPSLSASTYFVHVLEPGMRNLRTVVATIGDLYRWCEQQKTLYPDKSFSLLLTSNDSEPLTESVLNSLGFYRVFEKPGIRKGVVSLFKNHEEENRWCVLNLGPKGGFSATFVKTVGELKKWYSDCGLEWNSSN